MADRMWNKCTLSRFAVCAEEDKRQPYDAKESFNIIVWNLAVNKIYDFVLVHSFLTTFYASVLYKLCCIS